MVSSQPDRSLANALPATTPSRRGVLKGMIAGAGALMLQQGARVASADTPEAERHAASTSVPSYVLPSRAGVDITAILTVGDKPAGNNYRMVGIPDGLGVFSQGRTFTVLMNHEITTGRGITRAHGKAGAFVSKWTIERGSLKVLAGQDLTQKPADVHLWDIATAKYVTGTTEWQRLCSADLPADGALRHGNRGTDARIFLDGEEVTEGRAWARIVTGPHAGEAWQLPRLGRMAFENVVASPHGKDKTIVLLTDDGALSTAPVAASNPSEVFVYIGAKQRDGHPIEQAGLTNGKLHGLRLFRNRALITEESNDFGLGDASSGYVSSARFELVELGNKGDVSSLSPLQMEQDAITKNVFRFQRPEDSAWDPRDRNKQDCYFVTTASITSNSRLWHLEFDDIDHPERGGKIEIVLNATRGRMFDNITIDPLGRLLLQEDTGNDAHISKIWAYGLDSHELVEVAHHDPALFEPGGPNFVTQDEESSGIITAHDVLGAGWFLLDVQVHKANPDAELVEYGQLVAMFVHPNIASNEHHNRRF